MRVLETVLIRSSIAMYPLFAIPAWLQVLTKMNPVTYASKSTKIITTQSLVTVPIEDVLIVLVFSILVGVLGVASYSRKVEVVLHSENCE